MKRLLVTGLSGFVGTALREALESEPSWGYSLCGPVEGYDMRVAADVRRLVAEARPDAVIHLAAQAHVMPSFEDPADTLQVNTVGTAHLLKALTDQAFSGRMLFVSSADVYGRVGEDLLPVTEAQPAAPRNPYASSKVAAEVLCQQWARSHGLQAVIARPFNHTGPGQRAEFALSGFARDAVSIRKGLSPRVLPVGNLDVTRDWLDVRDVVRAYFDLLAKGETGRIYNVCSGRELRLDDMLRMILDCAGVQAEVVADPSRMRPAEQRRMRGSNEALSRATGWTPRYELRETVQRLIDYWDKEVE